MLSKLLIPIFLIIFANTPRASAGVTESWYPLPVSTNQFLINYPQYARMLWAFDYGHSLIYEQMWKNALAGDFDFCLIESNPNCETTPPKTIFDRIQDILASPPTQAPSEDSISPQFTTEFSWVMNMFEWTHKLHWIAYDVLANEPPERAQVILQQQVDEAYRRFPSLALPTQCKSMMQFMEGQPFSMLFRTNSPNANGIIWAYHYYQLALYEALLIPAGSERDAALAAIMKKFKWMASDPANNVPQMPMARVVAPNFYKQYKALAAIFDNLHEYHDVVGDLLTASDNTYGSPQKKKTEMDRTMTQLLDNVSYIIDCDKNGHE